MSWMIIGTVPHEGFPLLEAPCSLNNGVLSVGKDSIAISRGTPALLAAATLAAQVLQIDPPTALIAGDTGKGRGGWKWQFTRD